MISAFLMIGLRESQFKFGIRCSLTWVSNLSSKRCSMNCIPEIVLL